MGFDYALVHVYFTIPPALILTLCAYPVLNRRHVQTVIAQVLIAFIATVPWDSYLIRTGIWTYPPSCIVGPRFFDIPLEECFFFVIQTYITSLLYMLANKPLLHPLYLDNDTTLKSSTKFWKRVIQAILALATVSGAFLILLGGNGSYLGLILAWASPVALFTFSLSGHFILSLPLTSTLLPIFLPTFYLWFIDERALSAGTWAISTQTKTNFTVWGVGSGHLDAEEALFFLMTNILITFGLAAFDNAIAIIDTFPARFPARRTGLPSPVTLARALAIPPAEYDMRRIAGIREAAVRLQRKSRSFFLASSAFTGRLRVDLVLLYSFCRMADDLVDEGAPGKEFAGLDTEEWIQRLQGFLDVAFDTTRGAEDVEAFVEKNFPVEARSAALYLPIEALGSESKDPLERLLQGFKTDTLFPTPGEKNGAASGLSTGEFPIKDDTDLVAYGRCVASTVGEMCVRLILFHHHCGDKSRTAHTLLTPDSKSSLSDDERLVQAAGNMGVALQLVNIARDIHVDSRIDRVYIPTSWLAEKGLSPRDLISSLTRTSSPSQKEATGKNLVVDVDAEVERYRSRLLDWAFEIYDEARPVMKMLPRGSRGAMVVAVESYMEIGRVLREKQGREVSRADKRTEGRATVPKGRRLFVALRELWMD